MGWNETNHSLGGYVDLTILQGGNLEFFTTLVPFPFIHIYIWLVLLPRAKRHYGFVGRNWESQCSEVKRDDQYMLKVTGHWWK